MTDTPPLPFLDLTADGFSTRSTLVVDARARHWCARTPFGLAVLRHRQAGQLLRDRRLRQGSHAWPQTHGLNGSFANFWQRSVISMEGPGHKATRALALSALSSDFIHGLIPAFEHSAATLTQAMLDQPGSDFIQGFSEPFAGQAIAALLGLGQDQAGALARDAATLGLAMGIDCKRHEARFNAATDRLDRLAADLLTRARAQRDPARFVDRLVIGNDAHPLDDQELRNLIVIAIFGGVDTTRAQLGFAMALFAAHPDQWHLLRATPDLVPQAIEEVIRARPTTTWSTREATETFETDGVTIRKGETLHILVHATGTDPAVAPEWQFDITQRRKAHFGFGGGAHHCLGQQVARTDMAEALRALLARVARIRLAAPPEWLPDSGNTSAVRLPLILETA